MRRCKTQGIGDLIRHFMRQEGLEGSLNEYRLIHIAWPEVMGQGIMRYTGDMRIRNQTLFIQIKSPALRQNLHSTRAQLVRRLNEAVGAQVITDIVFR